MNDKVLIVKSCNTFHDTYASILPPALMLIWSGQC